MPQTLPRQTVSANPALRGLLSRWTPRGPSSHGPLIQRILAARGLADPASAAAFLKPQLTHLHEPGLMPGIDASALRLVQALRNNQQIVIYGDYDVDGITATSVLYHALKCLEPAADVRTYIPHRIDEGYGLNAEALCSLADAGADVIVTVDCGITAVEPARTFAQHTQGRVDLIITDHHNVPSEGQELPHAFALVHPRLPGSTYPFGELCGAGVAYKLAWRIGTAWSGESRVPERMRALLIELLALVSMGIVADIVPLVDENRVLAHFGLGRIRSSQLPGLHELISSSGLDGEKIAAEDVGFKLGPRLNASGRMGHAREALELLTVASGPRAIEIADMLSRKNDERRAVEKSIVEQAESMAIAAGMTTPDKRAIVLGHPNWHAGVVGIACSRLVEKYHRPVILMGGNEHGFHGSGRSVPGFSLHAALEDCRAVLDSFGGHDMAAGVRLAAGNLAAFTELFIQAANAKLAPADLIGHAHFDADVSLEELEPGTVLEMKRLEPFGRDNPKVVLRLPDTTVKGRPTLMGRDASHLSFRVGTGQRQLRIVGWRLGALAQSIPDGARASLLFTPSINDFAGRKSVEGELVDIALH